MQMTLNIHIVTVSEMTSSMALMHDGVGRVQVYVDGSCSFNGCQNAVAGIGVWFGDQHPLNVSETLTQPRVTNIVAEILAVIKACQICLEQDLCKAKILTDSQYLIDCITEHIQKWKTNGWKNAKGKPVVNQELFQKLDQLLTNLDIQFEHVRGHRGNHGNEQADRLAKRGAGILKEKKKKFKYSLHH